MKKIKELKIKNFIDLDIIPLLDTLDIEDEIDSLLLMKDFIDKRLERLEFQNLLNKEIAMFEMNHVQIIEWIVIGGGGIMFGWFLNDLIKQIYLNLLIFKL